MDSQLPHLKGTGYFFMNKFHTKAVKFILTFCFSTIALFTLVITSFAWFAAQKHQGIQGSKISVEVNSIVESVNVYSYYVLPTVQNDANSNRLYTFYKEVDNGTASADNSNHGDRKYNLGNYSILSDGQYQLLIKVNLTTYGKSLSNITLAAHSNAACFLTETQTTTDSSGATITELKDPLKYSASDASVTNSLTSIVNFYAFKSANIDTTNTSYNSVILPNNSNIGTSAKNFAAGETGAHTLNSDVTIASLASNDFATSGYFYILVDYNIPLIEEVFSANINNPVINNIDSTSGNDQTWIKFSCDFFFHVKDGGEA